MIRIRLLLFGIFIFAIMFQTTTYAQFKDYGLKLGISGNYLHAQNEFGGGGFLAKGFMRLEINQTFDLDFSAGYGEFAGDDFGGNDYKTDIAPVELRMLATPWEFESWNPYFYVGIGATWWWLDDPPANPARPPEDKYTGLNFLIPIGIGTEIALSKNWVLDITAGWNAIIDDWPNGYKSNSQNLWHHDWDRYVNVGIGIAYAFGGCEEDSDNDELSNCDEEDIGTDPYNADTDGDGLKDGEEVLVYNTDPLKVDSNGDGLTDYEKVRNYHLDPNSWDNDGDDLSDYDEIRVHNTDPKNPDTDGEGLTDGAEVNTHMTNPTKPDTDGDRLNDYDEIFTHKTDPLKSDTDGDILSDGDEVNSYQTNPLLQDTDGGSIKDGIEVKRGTDPLNPNDDIVVAQFENILFAFDSYKLDKTAVNQLQKVLKFMLNNKDVDLNISGHTDDIGTKAYNQVLSEKRAKAAKDWLVRNGVSANRIFTKGFGMEKPVADNKTKSGRRLNRRVELKVGEIR